MLVTNGLASNVHLQNIQIINCKISSYGWDGIFITGTVGFAGYADVLVQGCEVSGCCNVAAQQNAGFGIGTAGINVGSPITGYGVQNGASFNNVVIFNCYAHNNTGVSDTNWTGSGIFCGQCSNALIGNCIAANNASAAGGSVGIWLADTINSVIDGCESYGTGTATNVDGDGFDLDGGCSHCTIQNCYSHGNAGAGYQVYSYSDGTVTASDSCSVINCISNGDGIGTSNGHPCGINLSEDATQTNVLIAGNTVYCSVSTAAAMWVRGSGASFTGLIAGNKFIVTGSQQMVHNTTGPANMILNGNNYYGTAKFLWNNSTYTSLTAWRTAFPAQEASALVTS